MLAEAEARGASGGELDEIEAGWMADHELVTFDQGLSCGFFHHVGGGYLISLFFQL